jgi:hypothetical protein
MPTWLEVLIAVIAVAGGGLGIAAIISAFQSRRSVRSAARQVDVEALTATITALQSENIRLYARLLEVERVQELAAVTIETLRAQVQQLEEENGLLRVRIDELERENCVLRGAR